MLRATKSLRLLVLCLGVVPSVGQACVDVDSLCGYYKTQGNGGGSARALLRRIAVIGEVFGARVPTHIVRVSMQVTAGYQNTRCLWR